MRRLFIILLTLYGALAMVHAQERQLQRYQYWFDQDQKAMTEQTLNGQTAEINTAFDANSLSEGMHTLYLRIGDSQGCWSPLQAFPVFATPLQSRGEKSVAAVEYWIDDIASRQTTNVNGTAWQQVLDVSALHEGMHTLYYRFVDNKAQTSPLQASTFMVNPLRNQGTKTVSKVEYWIDSDIVRHQTASVNGGLWSMTFDASMMPEGMHTLYYRFADNYNEYGALQQTIFMKQQEKATQVVKLRYWWSDRTDLVTEIDATEQPFSYTTLLSVPDYDRRDPLSDKGVALFTMVAVDDQGRLSAPLCEQILYARYATITAKKSTVTAGTPVTLSWSYADEAGVRDYSVYYAKDNGSFILWKPATTDTSVDFKGARGTYRFAVVARNNLGQRTNLDAEGAVSVTFE